MAKQGPKGMTECVLLFRPCFWPPLCVVGTHWKSPRFHVEIDEWLTPDITFSSTKESWCSYEDMFQARGTAHPTREHAWRLEIPSTQWRMMTASKNKPEETADIFFPPFKM